MATKRFGSAVRNQDDVQIDGYLFASSHICCLYALPDRGMVCFYQSEFPYGVDHDFARNEFRGFLIDASVLEHEVYAPGVYSNFRSHPVMVSTAVEHPPKESIRVLNPFTVKLDNDGGILSVVNGYGGVAKTQGKPVRLQ